MAWLIRFPESAAKSTSVKQGDLYRRESKNTTGIYESPVPRPPSFLSTPKKTGHYPLWDEAPIDRDSHWYTRMVKEAIPIRLHPNNINRDSGIEIPEARMHAGQKIKHNRKMVQQRIAEGTTSCWNNEDRNAPITANHRDINDVALPVDLIA